MSQKNITAASRIQSAEAKSGDGTVHPESFASRAQRAAALHASSEGTENEACGNIGLGTMVVVGLAGLAIGGLSEVVKKVKEAEEARKKEEEEKTQKTEQGCQQQ